MKANKIMFLVAAATMLFAACGKDPESIEAKENTLVVGSTEYKMHSTYKMEQGGRVYVDAYAVETVNDHPIFYIVSDDPENGTYDLTKGEVFFAVNSEVDYIPSFYHESEYTSGTLVVAKDTEAFRLKMNGTLADGTVVAFHIYVPASEWEQLEW